jgi:hypothetical protein
MLGIKYACLIEENNLEQEKENLGGEKNIEKYFFKKRIQKKKCLHFGHKICNNYRMYCI